LAQYFTALRERGSLNAVESVCACQHLLAVTKKADKVQQLLEENNLQCSQVLQ
jgi:hypothetical protein